MKKKNGFISTTIIYSFFLVFILIMIAILMSYANKAFLKDKIADNIDQPGDGKQGLSCDPGNDLLSDCLIKAEYMEHERDNTKNTYLDSLTSATATVNNIQDEIEDREPPNLGIDVTAEDGIYTTIDDDGTTYYYRGKEDDNYVSFAGKLWSIIRINGNGSIRLIYQGELDNNKTELYVGDSINKVEDLGVIDVDRDGKITENDARHYNIDKTTEISCSTYEWLLDANRSIKDATCGKVPENERDKLLKWICNNKDKRAANYSGIINDCGNSEDSGATSLWNIGFMKNTRATVKNESKFNNNIPSDILEYLYSWYIKNIEPYSNFINLDDSRFCANKDVSLEEKKIMGVTYTTEVVSNRCICTKNNVAGLVARTYGKPCTTLGLLQGTCESKNFNSGFQINYFTESAPNIVSNKVDDLKCVNDISTYLYPNKENDENGQLSYPIGLITASELLLAGNKFNKSNAYNYLNSNKKYWTSDLAYGGNEAVAWAPVSTHYFVYHNNMIYSIDDNLQYKSDWLPKYGDGTAYLKPVINLNKCVKYTGGDGTIGKPYLIEEVGDSC